MQALWTALAQLPPAVWIRESGTAYLLVNAAHILSLGYLLGNIITLDLRLLGVFRTVALSAVGPMLSSGAAAGLLLAIITGVWLFSVDPASYLDNPAFLSKLALVALGLLNAVWLHGQNRWRTALSTGRADAIVRMHAGASLGFWVAAVLAGRWIGFI
ncbi:DUF2214 domain-containing protein [Pseudomonas saliphila]|uniref:DUF2214 domain-containing protein n=1 Tax=Pseudomonas saliphila TaxID=2586906 RepID=UPI001239C855|nr:DUF2214 domain-containing protein [Pseudomonas saliphila]